MRRGRDLVRAWRPDPWDDTGRSEQVEDARNHRTYLRWWVYGVGLLAVVALVVAGLVGLWYVRRVNPAGDPGVPQTFTINDKDNLVTISQRLEQQGMVSDASLFRWYVDHHGGLTITSGYYRVRKADHMGNVMRVLNTPPNATFTKVLFPEGYTAQKMANHLSKVMPRLKADAFMTAVNAGQIRSQWQPSTTKSLEGLLFPDTYQISNAETETMVIRRMVREMNRVGTQLNLSANAKKLGYTPYQVLIIASIIEREAKTSRDRGLIARVIYNRLYLNMPLQIDATLLYTQPIGTKVITQAMLKEQTPYNSYLNKGLPPTPIANPGRASIEAALNPTPNPAQGEQICKGIKAGQCMYLFYVLSDEDGNHSFWATGTQFAAAKQEALKNGLIPK